MHRVLTANADESATDTATDRAYHRIRAGVLSGEFSPGSRLTEVELASIAGVSRTPVREALRRLHAERLVAHEANRGVRVASLTTTELESMYALRALLEEHAARRAARNCDPATVGKLEALANEMDRIAGDVGYDKRDLLTELNLAFHGLVVGLAGSPALAEQLGRLIEVPLAYRTVHIYTRTELARSHGHHRELIAALTSRDEDWAGGVMRCHVLAARHVLMASYQK